MSRAHRHAGDAALSKAPEPCPAMDARYPTTERRGIRIVVRGTLGERFESLFAGFTVARRAGATVWPARSPTSRSCTACWPGIRDLG